MLPLFLLALFMPVGDGLGQTDYLLSRVNKILIQKDGLHGIGSGELGRFPVAELLAQELSARGYIIVGNASNADAILKGTHTAKITLDAQDLHNPDYDRYKFELIAKNGERLWTATITIYEGEARTLKDIDKKASVLVADKLNKAIRSALRKMEKQSAH